MEEIRYFVKDKLQCYIYDSREHMGQAAAKDILAVLHLLLKDKDYLNVMFAAAPSQNEVLAGLVDDNTLDWSRINAFHMDEYIGLSADAPQGFGNFLRDHIFKYKPFHSVNYIRTDVNDVDKEASRYEALLRENPIDLCILGVGENGHVAFNDPPVADFKDTRLVKPVKLDLVCREQQVHDGCFASIGEVPEYALTVTVPGLVRAHSMFCVVPAATKASAIQKLVHGPISESCPSSILRTHNTAKLYLEPDSASFV